MLKVDMIDVICVVLTYALDGSRSRPAIQSTTTSSKQEPTIHKPHIIIGHGQEC